MFLAGGTADARALRWHRGVVRLPEWRDQAGLGGLIRGRSRSDSAFCMEVSLRRAEGEFGVGPGLQFRITCPLSAVSGLSIILCAGGFTLCTKMLSNAPASTLWVPVAAL